MISGLLFFYGVFCYCFPLKRLCSLHGLASNESSDCNIFSGATQSSVKSSDCVTNFPVQGGIAVDCVPSAPGCGSLGFVQNKQRELEGGSPAVAFSTSPNLESGFSRERYQTARLTLFSHDKNNYLFTSSLASNLSGNVFFSCHVQNVQ